MKDTHSIIIGSNQNWWVYDNICILYINRSENQDSDI